MRQDFCDRCERLIHGFTMTNRVLLPPDDKGADLCSPCIAELRDIVTKWKNKSPAHS